MFRLLFIVTALFLGSCSLFQSDGLSPEQRRESDRINKFFEEVYEENVSRSPQRLTRLGRKERYDELNDRSEQYARERLEIAKENLQRLRTDFNYELLPHQDQISYRLFEQNILNRIEGFEFRYHRYVINQMRGVHTHLPSFMMNMHTIDDESDARAYISRLKEFKQQFVDTLERMDKSFEKGIVPPQFIYSKAISDSRNIISGYPFDKSAKDSSPLYEDFERKIMALDLGDELNTKLLKEAEQALLSSVSPGYKMLIEKLEELEKVAPAEGSAIHLPRGDEYYAMRLRLMTTTDMSADEIHEMGLRETRRIHDEMREIISEVGFDGDLQDFFEYVRTSSDFRYPDTVEGRQQYIADTRALIDEMEEFLPELFKVLPQAPVDIRPVEPFREQSAGLAFYQGPSEDGERPGIYYINLYDMDSVDTYSQEALAYHEAIPGHHLQIAIATELEDVPSFRKYGRYTVFSEGWGLYAEYIPYEYGFYQDHYSNFGRLAMELHRSARLVVDTGLHHKGWTVDETVAWLDENTPKTHRENVRSTQRYVVMPGQATAYFIGMQKILELKELAENKLGDNFDIRRFHYEILKDGAVPISVLEEKIADWIERELG